MLHPTLQEITKGQLNKYEFAIGIAKCTRKVVDEQIQIHQELLKTHEESELQAQKAAIKPEEAAKSAPVHIAMDRLSNGYYRMVRKDS